MVRENCEAEEHICEISVRKGPVAIFLTLGIGCNVLQGIITINGVPVCNY